MRRAPSPRCRPPARACRPGRRASAAAPTRRAASATRGTVTANTVPTPGAAAQRQRRIQQLRDAVGDRQAQAQPLPRRILAAAELLEDGACCVRRRCPGRCRALRCAARRRRGARRARCARPACSAPRWRGSSAARAAAVADRCAPRRASARSRSRRPRSAASTRNSDASGSSTSASAKSRGCGSSPPASSRDMSSSAGQQVGRSNPARRGSAARVSRAATSRHLLRQRIGEQVRGVQRLQQVVADRGEEAALRVVGALGLAPARPPARRCARPRAAPASRSTAAARASVRRNAVTSVKVATKPPPGIGLPRISTMLPSGNTRSVRCGVPARMCARRRCSARSGSPCGGICAQRLAREVGDRAGRPAAASSG